MSDDRPFLTPPSAAGQEAGGASPAPLFDLAVNRAWRIVQTTGPAALDAWHARTRFARRVPLSVIRAHLTSRPAEGEWHWEGGEHGGWAPGRSLFP